MSINDLDQKIKLARERMEAARLERVKAAAAWVEAQSESACQDGMDAWKAAAQAHDEAWKTLKELQKLEKAAK